MRGRYSDKVADSFVGAGMGTYGDAYTFAYQNVLARFKRRYGALKALWVRVVIL